MKASLALRFVQIVVATSIPLVAEGGLRPSVELGFSYSTLVYERELESWDNGWRPSFTTGVFVPVPVGPEWLSLMPGVRYVRQGNRVRIVLAPGWPPVGEFRLSHHYLALPVLVKLGPPGKGFFMTLGPEMAYLLAAHSDLEFWSGSGSSYVHNDDLALMERWNLSVGAGAGLGFPIGSHQGVVQFRYWEGLKGTAREGWVSDWRTRNLETVVGIRW